MRVAIVSEGFAPYIGGVETRYTKIAEHLTRKHDVDVITLLQKVVGQEGEKILEIEQHGRLRVFRINVENKYFLADGTRSLRSVREFSRKCAEHIVKNSYDILLVSEWPLLHVLYIRKKTHQRNMLVDWHEVWGRYYLKFGLKGFGGWVLERIVAKLDGIKHIAVSEFTRERLRDVLGVKEDIPVIWNGVDPMEYNGLSNVKKEFGKIVFFGRFAPHKGIDLLIEAFKIVKRAKPETSLHIIGDGPLTNQVVEMASNVKDTYVAIALPRKRLLENIKSAWMVVIPSYREGQGISYLEAMAAGTPVISVRSPYNAFSSMVKNGEDALIADPDAHSLAVAILKLLKDEELYTKLSNNGRIFASRFSWDNICSKLEVVFEDVLEKQ
jgi:glycosyltransferase involved in cell wall biosynthesis